MEATPGTRHGGNRRRALPTPASRQPWPASAPSAPSTPSTPWLQGLLWLLLVGAVAWQLGGYGLLDPDEGRNAEVAREMMASGDYVLPRLDGLPYLDKPVLFFAADALCQRLLGAGETAARLPSLLFALATAALTGWFAGRLFGRRARGIAAVAALAAPLPIAFGRTVIFDSMLACFVVLALCAFYLAVEARAARAVEAGAGKRSVGYLGWTALAWIAMALGVLTKGPVALAVPLLAAAPYAIFRRASRAVWHPLGMALLALVVGPWIWAMSRQVPEFLPYALFTETWQRVTTPEMNREGPLWFFIPCLLAGTLPWSVLVLGGWRRSLRPRPARGGRLDPPRLYLLLWIGLPLVLFSLSHSKRPQYILPLVPAVAILAAKVWVDAEDGGGAGAAAAAAPASGAARPPAGPTPSARLAGIVPGARAAAWAWLALALLCGGAAAAVPRLHSDRLAHVALLPRTLAAMAAAFLAGAALAALGSGRRGGRPPEPRLAAGAPASPAGTTTLAGDGSPQAAGTPACPTGTSTLAASDSPPAAGEPGLRGRPGAAVLLAGLVLPMAAMPALLVPLLDEIAGHRSSRAAAAAIAPRLGPGAEVVAVHAFPPSLPFYLRRTLLVATPRGRELTSNYVIAYFRKWIAADPRLTPLRPSDWWRQALAACDHPLVFVTWADDAATRAELAAAGLPQIVANDRMAAYGPCTPRPARPAAAPSGAPQGLAWRRSAAGRL